MPEKIGFIGLGVMGTPMAKNVSKKFSRLSVFDVDCAKMEVFASEDIKTAGSVAQAGSVSDTVVLSLPNSQIVRDVILGSDGLANAMNSGGTIIDTSTIEPTVSIEISTALNEKGINFLDAPMSGGEKAAIEGTLSFMVGGDEGVFNQCLEFLKTMGATVVHMGDSGMGQVTKSVNQMIVGATFAIIAEGFALGVTAGLDPGTLYEAIRNGWAGSKVLDVAAPAMLERNFKPGGTVNIHAKDLSYALSLAKDKDVPTPVTALVHEIFKAAKAGGRGSLSQPAIVTLWEDLLGTEVKGRT